MVSVSRTILLFSVIFATPISIVSILFPLIPIPLIFSSIVSILVMFISIIFSFFPSRFCPLILFARIVLSIFSFILSLPILILIRTIFIQPLCFLPLLFILSWFLPLPVFLAFIVRFTTVLLFYLKVLLFLFLNRLNCWRYYLHFLLF